MKKVLLFGTFDILHLGHLNLFMQAKSYGDHLTVVVARDKRVAELKGEAPLHTEVERSTFLKHITDIDDVRMGHETDVYACIAQIAPDIICLGYDQQVYVDKLAEKLIEFGLDQTEIVRLNPYKPEQQKSSTLKQRLLAMI